MTILVILLSLSSLFIVNGLITTRSRSLVPRRVHRVLGTKTAHHNSLKGVEEGNMDEVSFLTSDKPNILLRAGYGVAWVLLTYYAFNLAPGAGESAAAIDLELAKKMITTPFDGQGSVIFASVFNSLGVLPAVYSALLLSGGKQQKIPPLLPCLAMFAGGFFAIGPYLSLRNYATEGVTKATRGRGSGSFESKLTGVLLSVFSLWLGYYAFCGDFSDNLKQYTELFWTQRLVHVSTIDAIILSLFVVDPMSEDMERRGFTGPPAAVFAALPILGPSMYLLARPELPEE